MRPLAPNIGGLGVSLNYPLTNFKSMVHPKKQLDVALKQIKYDHSIHWTSKQVWTSKTVIFPNKPRHKLDLIHHLLFQFFS